MLRFKNLGSSVTPSGHAGVSRRILRGTLIGVDGFAAVSALLGAVELETGWPYMFPTTMLQGTPFSDFAFPGLIMGLVVGGSAAIAMVATIRNASAGAAWSLIAGFTMAGWIIGEVFLLDVLATSGQSLSPYVWLQLFYFGVGLAMVLLSIGLAPDSWRAAARRTHLVSPTAWR
jgi:hypothetical protein